MILLGLPELSRPNTPMPDSEFAPRLYDQAFVWVWLPDATDPVVAGHLSKHNKQVVFSYDRNYLDNHNAISPYSLELPLATGLLAPKADLHIAGCIDDAAPDSWGQSII